MLKYIVEYIGTFLLVLVIVCTVNTGLLYAPLIIGLSLAVFIYGGYKISGAHYNPAVTLTMIVLGKIKNDHIAGYFTAQILGAVSASLIGVSILGMAPQEPAVDMRMIYGLSAELLGTFILCFVILITAAFERTAGNKYYGIAIGMTVVCISWGLGSWSGGAFNPAVGTGMLIGGMITTTSLTLIVLANVLGALMAVWLFQILFGEVKSSINS